MFASCRPLDFPSLLEMDAACGGGCAVRRKRCCDLSSSAEITAWEESNPDLRVSLPTMKWLKSSCGFKPGCGKPQMHPLQGHQAPPSTAPSPSQSRDTQKGQDQPERSREWRGRTFRVMIWVLSMEQSINSNQGKRWGETWNEPAPEPWEMGPVVWRCGSVHPTPQRREGIQW